MGFLLQCKKSHLKQLSNTIRNTKSQKNLIKLSMLCKRFELPEVQAPILFKSKSFKDFFTITMLFDKLTHNTKYNHEFQSLKAICQSNQELFINSNLSSSLVYEVLTDEKALTPEVIEQNKALIFAKRSRFLIRCSQIIKSCLGLCLFLSCL